MLEICLLDEVREEGWMYVTFGGIVPFKNSFGHIWNWMKERES